MEPIYLPEVFFSNHLPVFEIRAAYFDRSILLPGPVPRLFILSPFSPFPFRTPIRVRRGGERGGDRGVLLGFRSLGILLGRSMNLL